MHVRSSKWPPATVRLSKQFLDCPPLSGLPTKRTSIRTANSAIILGAAVSAFQTAVSPTSNPKLHALASENYAGNVNINAESIFLFLALDVWPLLLAVKSGLCIHSFALVGWRTDDRRRHEWNRTDPDMIQSVGGVCAGWTGTVWGYGNEIVWFRLSKEIPDGDGWSGWVESTGIRTRIWSWELVYCFPSTSKPANCPTMHWNSFTPNLVNRGRDDFGMLLLFLVGNGWCISVSGGGLDVVRILGMNLQPFGHAVVDNLVLTRLLLFLLSMGINSSRQR